MNLIVDIGNSTAKAALFEGDKMLLHRRLKSDLVADLSSLLDEFEISDCAYATVGHPQPDVESLLRRVLPTTLRVTGDTPTPLLNDYRTPSTLGADRLAASVGAASLHPGRSLLVVDAGTCVTYDYISAEGHYLGGSISPGLGMRLRALHDQTALLPEVSAEGDLPTIGYDTPTSIRTGVITGMEYEIRGFIRIFLHRNPNGCVFLTGGNGYRFAQEVEAERSDALVEIGLNRILLYNR